MGDLGTLEWIHVVIVVFSGFVLAGIIIFLTLLCAHKGVEKTNTLKQVRESNQKKG